MNLVLIDASLAGVSGDKLISAFASASGRRKDLESAINSALGAIGRTGTEVFFEEAESHGMKGLRLNLMVPEPDGKEEGGVKKAGEALEILNAAAEAIGLSESGKRQARSTMELLISTERAAHGVEILHELGSIDTVVDIIGTFKAIELLGVESRAFFTTPVAVGSGAVLSSHGLLPVPAPATLSIMSRTGLPITRTEAQQELTTPTGAALLATLTAGRVEIPPFRATSGAIGVGIGRRELGFPNITRVILGEPLAGTTEEEIFLVETNVDDVDGEVLGWIFEKLSGVAEDVCMVPMLTKKNRPGHLIRVVSTADSVGKVIDAILEETGTLGVKVSPWRRVKVAREESVVDVNIRGKPYNIRVKTNLRTGSCKPAYDDCKRVAVEEKMPLRSVIDLVRAELQPKEKKAD
ncbi:MAG: nickel pincer cofactor biosynthesis protein LarC [Candidatus Methanosuratus sp.]|nr:nickel pincer cofactor biosynthesis protein LarC [Candidatus Methanosuratincola sp.]